MFAEKYKGYKMKNPYQTNLEFLPPFPQIKIIGNGCILPNSQGLIFPFQTINLKAVEVRIVKIFETNCALLIEPLKILEPLIVLLAISRFVIDPG
jgi:hypothetical protein